MVASLSARVGSPAFGSMTEPTSQPLPMMAPMLPLAIRASWVASSTVVPPTENSFCRSFQVLTPSTNFGSDSVPVHLSPLLLATMFFTPKVPAPKEAAAYQFWPGR